jgi:glycosyltransferase involved in cell wall biosynthesis
MSTDPISVVIPVRNEGARIRRAVESILCGRSRAFPLEIVIVDDASHDGACDALAGLARGHEGATIVVKRLERWSGIPFARNRGAEAARHPLLVVTDGNTEFPRDWNEHVWRHMQPGRILCATIADLDSSFRGYGCQLQLPSMGVTWIPVPGAYGGQAPVAPCTCSVIERALFLQLGGYDEALPIYGAAEPEFSVRAWLSGCEIVQVPELVIRHRFRPRAEFDAYRASIKPVLVRNYLRFACCYLPREMLARAYAFYGGGDPTAISRQVEELVGEGVWQRRAQLSGLPRSFEWFAERFALPGRQA